MKLTKKGNYESSQVTIEGNKKMILAYLRDEALTMREDSRQVMKCRPTVHALHIKKHTSKIVNLASFAIKKMGIDQLLPLMNVHGVMKYTC